MASQSRIPTTLLDGINCTKATVHYVRGLFYTYCVEEKLGERSQLEEQVRTVAKQVEKVVTEALWSRGAERATIRFKKLDNFEGELPAYATPLASGRDVRARL